MTAAPFTTGDAWGRHSVIDALVRVAGRFAAAAVEETPQLRQKLSAPSRAKSQAEQFDCMDVHCTGDYCVPSITEIASQAVRLDVRWRFSTSTGASCCVCQNEAHTIAGRASDASISGVRSYPRTTRVSPVKMSPLSTRSRPSASARKDSTTSGSSRIDPRRRIS